MGIDGNFAGGFSQGAQPVLQGIRQDRRDASQRAFKEKLINNEKTAQDNIRKENQKIRSDKEYMANLFRTQQQGTENDRFQLQQGLGRSLQGAQKSNAQSRRGVQDASNVVLKIQQAQAGYVKDNLAILQKAAPGGIVDEATLTAATQRFSEEAQQRFGKDLRVAQLRANDLIDSDRAGSIRLEDLQNQFQGALAQITDRNSLRNIATSNKGKLLQSTFGKTDDDVSKLFGELGEPTQQNGIDLFGTSTPTPERFDVAPLSPEQALQKEIETATQTQTTKRVSKADPHNAIRQIDSLTIDKDRADGANEEVRKTLSGVNKKLREIVSKNPKDSLSATELDTLTTLFKEANALSAQELGEFAVKNQNEEEVISGKGLKSRFALNQATSPAIEKRVAALKKEIENINPDLEGRTKFAIRGDEFKPKQSDDLKTLIQKQQAWIQAGTPTVASRNQTARHRKSLIEGFFKDAIQNRTEAKQKQNLIDEIEPFRARLIK